MCDDIRVIDVAGVVAVGFATAVVGIVGVAVLAGVVVVYIDSVTVVVVRVTIGGCLVSPVVVVFVGVVNCIVAGCSVVDAGYVVIVVANAGSLSLVLRLLFMLPVMLMVVFRGWLLTVLFLGVRC